MCPLCAPVLWCFSRGRGRVDPKAVIIWEKVGGDVSVEDAYAHSWLVGLQLLAVLRDAADGLDRVVRMVKIFGMVNSVADFGRHPQVINGCSDLFIEVLGERGRHARSAVGIGSLPDGITVEIEAIAEVQ